MAVTTYALRYTGSGQYALALRLGHKKFINNVFSAGESLDVTDLASLGELQSNSELRTLLADGTFALDVTQGTSDIVSVAGDAVVLVKRIDLNLNGGEGGIDISAGTETDTGWDFPDDAVLLDVFLDVEDEEATGTTKTIDVGLLSSESGGDANGFIAAFSVATAGRFRPSVVHSSHVVGTQTRGALLQEVDAGASDDDRGFYVETPYVVGSAAARSVSVTAGDTDWEEFKGAVYFYYMRLLRRG